MNRKTKIGIVAGTAAAFAVAGGGAAVAGDALSREDESKAVIDDAAKQLGVEPSELSAALKEALQNRVDEAVDAGTLTAEQARALKARIEAAEVPLLFGGLGGRGFGPSDHAHVRGFEAAASFLGLTEAELQDELAESKSLADIAKAEGKSVAGLVRALVADAEQRLDDAVDDGRLTQAQADVIRNDLDERITALVNREPGSERRLRGPEFRDHGLGGAPHPFRDGPPGFPGHRA